MESQQLIFARAAEGSNNWANLSAERLGKMEVKLTAGRKDPYQLGYFVSCLSHGNIDGKTEEKY